MKILRILSLLGLVSLILGIVVALQPQRLDAQTAPSLEAMREGWWLREAPLALNSDNALAPNSFMAPVGEMKDWSRIVYQRFYNYRWVIYGAQGDGSGEGVLTSYQSDNFSPRLNRGATRIVFVSTRDAGSEEDSNSEIYTMQVDGSQQLRLTYDPAIDSDPAWSPDGTQIVFVTDRDGNAELYQMAQDGSGLRRLTYDGSRDSMPSWSPDGSQIAWIRRVDNRHGVLMVMQADGSAPYPLTGPLQFLENPTWSPEGTHIAFDYDANGDLWNELAIIRRDGTDLHVVYDPEGDNRDAWMGSWSPDGQFLLFTEVTYDIRDDQLLIQWSTIRQAWAFFLDRVPSGVIGDNLTFNPDWQSTDTTAPRSSMNSLPPYSRVSAFRLSWSGIDEGGAGLTGYDVEYRPDTSQAWVRWQSSTASISQPFAATAGTTVHFRSRARDQAHNVEAWPSTAEGDTSTTFYTWNLSGQLTDNRGVPRPPTPLALEPAALDEVKSSLLGSYHAHLTTDGIQTIQLPSTSLLSRLTVNGDMRHDLYIPPAENLMMNGSFESGGGLDKWQLQGTLPITVTNSTTHAGVRAAQLGLSCPPPCLAPAERPAIFSAWESPPVVVDSQGYLHMILVGQDLSHTRRSPRGEWSPLRPLTTHGRVDDFYKAAVLIDPSDRLHVVWVERVHETDTYTLHYSRQTGDTTWTAPLSLGEGVAPRMVMDQAGTIHLLHSLRNQGGFFYLTRTVQGSWSHITTLSGSWCFDLTSDPHGGIRLVWYDRDEETLFYQERYADGTFGAMEPAQRLRTTDWAFHECRVLVDLEGKVHLISKNQSNGLYTTRLPGGQWLEPSYLPAGSWLLDGTIDEKGTLHLITNSGLWGEHRVHYRRLSREGVWLPTALLDESGVMTKGSLAVARDGTPHLLVGSAGYITSATVRAERQGSLTQSLTVPATLIQPTLAFAYQLDSVNPTVDSGLVLTITQGMTATQVLTASAAAPGWSLGWVDLRPWAGQAISVTFSLYQAQGEPPLLLRLDNVTLGGWRTPVAHTVTPTLIERDWGGKTVTIAGENFAETPQVRVGETLIAQVRRLDETALEIILPPSLQPGVHSISITNPTGEASVLSGALWLGRPTYLPLTLR